MGSQETREPGEIPLEGPERAIALDRPPSIAGQYLRALARAGRPRGRLRDDRAQVPIAVELAGRSADPASLAGFRTLCDLPQGEGFPCAFVETLFQGLLVELVLDPAFPASPFGLVHLRQRLEGPRTLPPGPLDLRCALAGLRSTRRGVEVDCAMIASRDGAVVWTGLATLLSRAAGAGRSGQRAASPPSEGWSGLVQTQVPADRGRRYAAVSGDWNPFHLHPLLARGFGFPRAIAHGMWTLAWALGQAERGGVLPERFRVEATFRRPLLLPGRASVRWRALPVAGRAGEGLEIEVRHPEQDLLHLTAQAEALPCAMPAGAR